jgi:hypothetical protein
VSDRFTTAKGLLTLLARDIPLTPRIFCMSSTITQLACDLNEQVDNRYELVLKLSDTAKRMLDEARLRKDDLFSTPSDTSSEKVIYQAIVMMSSEYNSEGLIG